MLDHWTTSPATFPLILRQNPSTFPRLIMNSLCNIGRLGLLFSYLSLLSNWDKGLYPGPSFNSSYSSIGFSSSTQIIADGIQGLYMPGNHSTSWAMPLALNCFFNKHALLLKNNGFPDDIFIRVYRVFCSHSPSLYYPLFSLLSRSSWNSVALMKYPDKKKIRRGRSLFLLTVPGNSSSW